MFRSAIHGSTAGLSLAIALMPAVAGARQVARVVQRAAPRVRVTTSGDDFVITAISDAPRLTTQRRSVPIGLSTKFDRDVFEPVAQSAASVRP